MHLVLCMRIKCPNPHCTSHSQSGNRSKLFRKKGYFYRKSDRKQAQRFICKVCARQFSSATFSKSFLQKKRHLNHKISRLLVAGVSLREVARVFKVNRKTAARKLVFMGHQAEEKLARHAIKRKKSSIIEFDDLETFEHTKCKPVSVTLAVEHKTRYILGFEVSQMPAKGLLARHSVKKYGRRIDERPIARKNLFKKLNPLLSEGCLIKSDENPHYICDVQSSFPKSEHQRFKGGRGCIVGQGELKKKRFDPLFALNHSCATLRARTNRLFRKTWCTTKSKERLKLHLNLVVLHHNLNLKTITVDPH